MNLPIGSIILWATLSIPDGWQVCDGTNGTPNLVGKFPLGASVDGDLLVTGGANTHSHTNTATGSRAAHGHTGISGTSGSSGSKMVYGGSTESASSPNHTHQLSGTVNSGDLHTHTIGNTDAPTALPPYKTLAYIMRMI